MQLNTNLAEPAATVHRMPRRPDIKLDGLYTGGYRIEVAKINRGDDLPDELCGRLVDDSRSRPAIDLHIYSPEANFQNHDVVNALLSALAAEIDSGMSVISLCCDVEPGE